MFSEENTGFITEEKIKIDLIIEQDRFLYSIRHLILENIKIIYEEVD